MRKIKYLALVCLLLACVPKELKKKEPSQLKDSLAAIESYVLKESVNLRAASSTESGIVCRMVDGDAIQVIDNQMGWYKVITEDGRQGWIRSNLAGPRNLSMTRMASVFVDTMLQDFNAEMYFDKKDLYKTLYLTLPEPAYKSKTEVSSLAKKIGRLYQEKVYPGKIEIRVLNPQSQELFLRLNLTAIGIANVPVPFLLTGRLLKLQEKNKTVTLVVAVSDSINNKMLLKTARNISAQYDYPFRKTDIYFVSAAQAGLSFAKDMSIEPKDKSICRLYYFEDKNGEDYYFDFCQRNKK